MRYYIEAYGRNGHQILGNLDGQAALGPCQFPSLTTAWKYLYSPKRPAWTHISHWKLVDEKGRLLQTLYNDSMVCFIETPT